MNVEECEFEKAWGRIDKAVCRMLWNYPVHLHDDLRQEARCGAWRFFCRYDKSKGAALHSWMYWGARAAIQHWMRDRVSLIAIPRSAQDAKSCDFYRFVALNECHEVEIEQGFERAEVAAALASLPHELRQIASLLMEGVRCHHVAEKLGRSRTYVKMRLRQLSDLLVTKEQSAWLQGRRRRRNRKPDAPAPQSG